MGTWDGILHIRSNTCNFPESSELENSFNKVLHNASSSFGKYRYNVYIWQRWLKHSLVLCFVAFEMNYYKVLTQRWCMLIYIWSVGDLQSKFIATLTRYFFFFSECYEMYYFYCRIFCSFYVKMHKEINIFLWIFTPVALITQSAPSRTQPI